MTFPTDLASFLELLRLHGDEAYSLIFAFAASHSMLFTLFASFCHVADSTFNSWCQNRPHADDRKPRNILGRYLQHVYW
jgi:hypothetical protein